ncbi:hypothetical protein [Vibrio sp. STUT-A11]|uniref:hypothetical protein n=1 Tax=unclassified Vibrio TaxID=2614977 RepID=UPI00222FD79A|nr:hypothetical protein [Vibrio sp. STUT-A11]BDR14368.1 hypothetical protein VspSTUT11_23440 [Vibrio sp. STUT-A11]
MPVTLVTGIFYSSNRIYRSTSSNVVGDTAVNTIVAKTEGEIGKEESVDAEPAQAYV